MSLRNESKLVDKSAAIRQGEELNIESLQKYLGGIDSQFSQISVEQFPGGFSNLTYLIKAGDKEYVLRRPPFGANIKSAHDMGREYKVLSMLKPIYDKVPEPIVYCEDESIMGAPFYVMERVRGIILRNTPPKDMSLTPALMKRISEHTIDNLANLHLLDIEKHGLIELGKPEGYAKRQVEGWIGRYEKSKTDMLPSIEEVSNWIKTNVPEDNKPCMIHNDYKYDNIVLSIDDPSKILAVLDWEMATVGDPLMDLGTTLAYWAEINDSPALKTFNLTWMPGNLNRQEVLDRYQEKTGIEAKNIVFYFAYASFKLGVICQQIYARYKKGLTNDPRFAGLIGVVKACGENGMRAIEKDRISNW